MAGLVDIQKEAYLNLANTLGRGGANALFPADYDYYLMSLELVDSKGRTADFLIFPVMPENISESPMYSKSISKSSGGVSVIKYQRFNTRKIQISGNFGRRLKFLIGRSLIDLSIAHFTENVRTISNQVKSGYGAIKLLERILENSHKRDMNGNPYRLHLYNMAFGTNYIVEVDSQPKFHQSQDKNMIWSYDINFTAIAPLNGWRSEVNRAITNLLSENNIEAEISQTYQIAKALIPLT